MERGETISGEHGRKITCKILVGIKNTGRGIAKNVALAEFVFKILIFRIPIWILLAVALVGFMLYRIKRRALDERQKFILSILDDREVGLTEITVAYKKR